MFWKEAESITDGSKEGVTYRNVGHRHMMVTHSESRDNELLSFLGLRR